MKKQFAFGFLFVIVLTVKADPPVGLYGGGSGGGAIMSTGETSNLNGYTSFTVTLMLEGLYNTTNHNMNKAQDYDGSNTIDKFSGSVADNITLELHDALSYATTVLQDESVLLNQNGTATVFLPKSGTYYLTIKHRNHIETVSASSINLAGLRSYNFSSSETQAFGSNQKLLETGVYGIYGGDVNGDGVIDLSDRESVNSSLQSGQTGYYAQDIDGNATIELNDREKVHSNLLIGAQISIP